MYKHTQLHAKNKMDKRTDLIRFHFRTYTLDCFTFPFILLN